MDLPTEIVDHILSFLQSDFLSLEACSQSHPILFQLVEPYLYTNITIVDPDDDLTFRVEGEHCLGAQELAEILDDNPHIAKHVRHLKINFQNYSGCLNTGSAYDCLKMTSVFLPLLSSLRKLTINHARTKYHAHWQNIQKNVRSVFLDYLRLPSLEEMHIENFVLNFALLKRCTESIKFLTLRRCSLRLNDEITIQDDFSCPSLIKSLSIEDCDRPFLQRSIAWVKAHTLRSLKLDSAYDNFESLFAQVLSSGLSSITILDLDFGSEVSTHYTCTMTSVEEQNHRHTFPFVKLSLPCLELLTLRAVVSFQTHASDISPEGIGTCPLWILSAPIPAMLQLVESSQSLKHLFLDFDYCSWDCPCAGHAVPHAECVWFPLLSLASASSSLSIERIYVLAKGNFGQGTIDGPYPSFPSVTECEPLMRYVEQGLVVIREGVSCGDGYEDSTFASS